MAIQQMGLLAYRAGQSGGDSAYLPDNWSSSGGTEFGGTTVLIFNYDNLSDATTTSDINSVTPPIIWRTGPYSADSYEVRFNDVSEGGTGYMSGAASNTWHNLGTINTPTFSYTNDSGTSTRFGRLIIRNASTLAELANVTFNFSVGNAI